MWRGGILLVIRRLPSERVGNRAMSGPRQHRIVEELRKQFPKLVRAFQSAVERGAPPTMPEQVDYSGMTVHKRLFSAGILKAWDAAAESRNRKTHGRVAERGWSCGPGQSDRGGGTVDP